MTAEEWDGCDNPEAMIFSLPPHSSVRKARLLIVACCRHLSSFLELKTQAGRDELLETMERRADESLPNNWSDAIWEDYEKVRMYEQIDGCGELVDCYMMITCAGLQGGLMTAAHAAETRGSKGELKEQTALVRCVFGNPFQPAAFDSAWRTSDVRALARGIYDDRAFDRMPILADALQDAGCDNNDILNHCRDANTPHARGCWVVDLVLGRG